MKQVWKPWSGMACTGVEAAGAAPQGMNAPERGGAAASALKLTGIDAHLHVDLYGEEERQAMLREAFENGIQAVVAVSMDLASSKRNHALALAHPGRVHPAYGFHPEQEPPSMADQEALFAWIRERHAVGDAFSIGEVGLPYYRRTEREAAGQEFDEAPYLSLLEKFIELAAELNKPIALHAVYEDAEKACALLEKYGVRKAHFHWFKGSGATVERMIEQGYMISITPDVRYEEEIIALVKRYPLSLLMVETDGPWPFEGPFEGSATTPGMIMDVIGAIAGIKGSALNETAEQLLRNTQQFYNL